MYFQYNNNNLVVSYSDEKNKVDNKHLKQFFVATTKKQKKEMIEKIQQRGTPNKNEIKKFINK